VDKWPRFFTSQTSLLCSEHKTLTTTSGLVPSFLHPPRLTPDEGASHQLSNTNTTKRRTDLHGQTNKQRQTHTHTHTDTYLSTTSTVIDGTRREAFCRTNLRPHVKSQSTESHAIQICFYSLSMHCTRHCFYKVAYSNTTLHHTFMKTTASAGIGPGIRQTV